MSNLNQLVMFWNEKAAEIMNVHTNPGHDSRRFAVVQIAIHDTLNYFEKKYQQYSHVIDIPLRFKAASIADAVNSAAYEALKWAITDINTYNDKRVSEGLPRIKFDPIVSMGNIQTWYNQQKAAIDWDADTVGLIWAESIINARESDGSKSVDIRSSVPADGGPNDTGIFRADYYRLPAPIDKKKLLVGFGKVSTFAVGSVDQFTRELSYTEEEMSACFDEVKEIGTAKYEITDENLRKNVDFWSSVRQHIVLNNFVRKLLELKSSDAWHSARLFALVHTAMADGAISMFNDIYNFKRWRPATAINAASGISPLAADAWKSRYSTPMVPEYPSTFGIFSGAVGEILQSFFGTDEFPETEFTYVEDEIQHSAVYSSISKAMEDNAITKIYCGWNFRKSIEESIKQGREIGRYVFDNKFQYIPATKVTEIPAPQKHRVGDVAMARNGFTS